MTSGQVVRAFISAFNEHDFTTFHDALSEDATVRQPLPDVGLPASPQFTDGYQGPAEITRMAEHLQSELGGVRIDIRDLEERDTVVLMEFMGLIGPPESRSALLGWAVLQVLDGKITKSQTFASAESARGAFESVV